MLFDLFLDDFLGGRLVSDCVDQIKLGSPNR